MVYTVTFNPSLDYIVRMDDFKSGMVNRTVSETIYPGGKGINVSIILSNLGIENTALGFVAGFTGDEIVKKIIDVLGAHQEKLPEIRHFSPPEAAPAEAGRMETRMRSG